MAPLVDIIFVVLREMKNFLIIYLISMVAFVQSYYILGRNQMEIEGHSTP